MSDLVTITSHKEASGAITVAVVGEIDLSNSSELDQALARLDSAPVVVVDLTGCTFFDSSCLAVLVRHAHAAREDGKHFSVRANRQGQQIVGITNLTELLRLESA